MVGDDVAPSEPLEWPRPKTPRWAERFAWLRDKTHHRSALMKVHTAIVRGWVIDGARRSDLVRELDALLDTGDLSRCEQFRIARIFEALDSGPSVRKGRPRRAAPGHP